MEAFEMTLELILGLKGQVTPGTIRFFWFGWRHFLSFSWCESLKFYSFIFLHAAFHWRENQILIFGWVNIWSWEISFCWQIFKPLPDQFSVFSFVYGIKIDNLTIYLSKTFVTLRYFSVQRVATDSLITSVSKSTHSGDNHGLIFH